MDVSNIGMHAYIHTYTHIPTHRPWSLCNLVAKIGDLGLALAVSGDGEGSPEDAEQLPVKVLNVKHTL
mgnify:CR=1 FL=1